ncbi:small ubiquitin-like modifier [Russula dissimulans]|nr:small ubiquitin-like modifier [Russula dissimulans]
MHQPQEEVSQSFVKEKDRIINLKVVSASGEEVYFKIKCTTKLSKLQGLYANKVGKDVSRISFLYDGARINDDDTPHSLDMQDNGFFFYADTMEVMVVQLGG